MGSDSNDRVGRAKESSVVIWPVPSRTGSSTSTSGPICAEIQALGDSRIMFGVKVASTLDG